MSVPSGGNYHWDKKLKDLDLLIPCQTVLTSLTVRE